MTNDLGTFPYPSFDIIAVGVQGISACVFICIHLAAFSLDDSHATMIIMCIVQWERCYDLKICFANNLLQGRSKMHPLKILAFWDSKWICEANYDDHENVGLFPIPACIPMDLQTKLPNGVALGELLKLQTTFYFSMKCIFMFFMSPASKTGE